MTRVLRVFCQFYLLAYAFHASLYSSYVFHPQNKSSTCSFYKCHLYIIFRVSRIWSISSRNAPSAGSPDLPPVLQYSTFLRSSLSFVYLSGELLNEFIQ